MENIEKYQILIIAMIIGIVIRIVKWIVGRKKQKNIKLNNKGGSDFEDRKF